VRLEDTLSGVGFAAVFDETQSEDLAADGPCVLCYRWKNRTLRLAARGALPVTEIAIGAGEAERAEVGGREVATRLGEGVFRFRVTQE